MVLIETLTAAHDWMLDHPQAVIAMFLAIFGTLGAAALYVIADEAH